MPTYDYLCDACGHQFELFQSINDPLKKKCPKCSKSKLRRLFGAGGGIVFKGSGFYTTDYRSESYKKAASADTKSGESKSGESKSGEAKSGESKSGEAKPTADAKSSKSGESKSTGKSDG